MPSRCSDVSSELPAEVHCTQTLTREGGEGANSSLPIHCLLHAGQPLEVSLSRSKGLIPLLLLLGSVACRPPAIVVRQHFVSHPASVYTLATTEGAP